MKNDAIYEYLIRGPTCARACARASTYETCAARGSTTSPIPRRSAIRSIEASHVAAVVALNCGNECDAIACHPRGIADYVTSFSPLRGVETSRSFRSVDAEEVDRDHVKRDY